MKKKLITVLGGVIIALSLFVTTGNTVKAAPKPSVDECSCDVSQILGVQKNIIVSNLVSSQEFKIAKQTTKNEGFMWRGTDNIKVMTVFNPKVGKVQILITVPFYKEDGSIEMAGFIDGVYRGHYSI
jgi:hypothetical protein